MFVNIVIIVCIILIIVCLVNAAKLKMDMFMDKIKNSMHECDKK